jgi:hypothetical protein
MTKSGLPVEKNATPDFSRRGREAGCSYKPVLLALMLYEMSVHSAPPNGAILHAIAARKFGRQL